MLSETLGGKSVFIHRVIHFDARDATGRGWDNPYKFGAKGGRTNKWVTVRRGGSERLMPLALVSNSSPTVSALCRVVCHCKL